MRGVHQSVKAGGRRASRRPAARRTLSRVVEESAVERDRAAALGKDEAGRSESYSACPAPAEPRLAGRSPATHHGRRTCDHVNQSARIASAPRRSHRSRSTGRGPRSTGWRGRASGLLRSRRTSARRHEDAGGIAPRVRRQEQPGSSRSASTKSSSRSRPVSAAICALRPGGHKRAPMAVDPGGDRHCGDGVSQIVLAIRECALAVFPRFPPVDRGQDA